MPALLRVSNSFHSMLRISITILLVNSTKMISHRQHIEWPSLDDQHIESHRSLKSPTNCSAATSPSDLGYAKWVMDSEIAKYDVNLGHLYD